jgi:hypothetical protein
VADGQVAAVHVHLPRHLLGTAQLHLITHRRTDTHVNVFLWI